MPKEAKEVRKEDRQLFLRLLQLKEKEWQLEQVRQQERLLQLTYRLRER